MENDKVKWKVTFENLQGNRVISLNSTCDKGGKEDNIEFWLEYWNDFLKRNPQKGWKDYRITKLERQAIKEIE